MDQQELCSLVSACYGSVCLLNFISALAILRHILISYAPVNRIMNTTVTNKVLLLYIIRQPLRNVPNLNLFIAIVFTRQFIHFFIPASLQYTFDLVFCVCFYFLLAFIQVSDRSLLQAIDEAKEEWSQHNAKKLIDTSK